MLWYMQSPLNNYSSNIDLAVMDQEAVGGGIDTLAIVRFELKSVFLY